MKNLVIALIACAALAGCDATSPTISATPNAAITDPLRDTEHPARNRQLLIRSRGEEMNALFFLAAGDGPKPTALLLHGLPGNERNLDLAQAIRRAGWNVLTFTYRGAWGSPGDFSIAHAIEDGGAAIAFLRTPETAATYNVDPNRLVVLGHSMGGLVAALNVDEQLAGIVLIDAWNAGAEGARVRNGGAEARTALIAGFDDLGHSLQGATAASMADEIIASTSWDITAAATRLASRPVLTIYASEGLDDENRALAEAIQSFPNNGVEAIEITSDHSFADHRIELSSRVVDWLQRLE